MDTIEELKHEVGYSEEPSASEEKTSVDALVSYKNALEDRLASELERGIGEERCALWLTPSEVRAHLEVFDGDYQARAAALDDESLEAAAADVLLDERVSRLFGELCRETVELAERHALREEAARDPSQRRARR